MQPGPTKHRLLLVDGDPKSLRVLDVSLKKAGFQVTTATNGVEALSVLETDAPELIISDTHMPELDGFELCRRIKQRAEWAKIPFIFLSGRKAIEDKIRGLELGVDDYLTKPIYMKEITIRVRMALQRAQREKLESRRESGRTRFAGALADIAVVDLVQTIELNRKSGIIHMVNRDGRRGEVYFRDGQIIDAEAGRLSGAEAIYRLFSWSEGSFEVEFKAIRRKDVIELSPQALLMEGMRRLDEWTRLVEEMPPAEVVFEVDYHLLADRLADLPDEVNSVLRLFDGRRTMLQVVDDADAPDLETLSIIRKLHAERLIYESRREERAPLRDATARLGDWLAEEAEEPPGLDRPSAVEDGGPPPDAPRPSPPDQDEARVRQRDPHLKDTLRGLEPIAVPALALGEENGPAPETPAEDDALPPPEHVVEMGQVVDEEPIEQVAEPAGAGLGNDDPTRQVALEELARATDERGAALAAGALQGTSAVAIPAAGAAPALETRSPEASAGGSHAGDGAERGGAASPAEGGAGSGAATDPAEDSMTHAEGAAAEGASTPAATDPAKSPVTGAEGAAAVEGGSTLLETGDGADGRAATQGLAVEGAPEAAAGAQEGGAPPPEVVSGAAGAGENNPLLVPSGAGASAPKVTPEVRPSVRRDEDQMGRGEMLDELGIRRGSKKLWVGAAVAALGAAAAVGLFSARPPAGPETARTAVVPPAAHASAEQPAPVEPAPAAPVAADETPPPGPGQEEIRAVQLPGAKPPEKAPAAAPIDEGNNRGTEAAPSARAEVTPITEAGSTAPAVPVAQAAPPAGSVDGCRKAYRGGRGRYKDVAAACLPALEANPRAAEVLVMLAHAELDRGRSREALAWARKAVAADPNRAEAYVFIGGAEQEAGRIPQARAAYEKYLKLAPNGRYAGDLRAILNSL